MNDTPADVEARMRELFMSRSAGDRVRAACEMFDLSRKVMVAGLQAENPGMAPEELRAKIFERTYGADFEPDERARIIAEIRAASIKRG